MDTNRTLAVVIDRTRAASEPGRFPVSISSEAPYTRIDERGPYSEVLSHQPSAIDLSRAPLPLIESHNTRKLNVGIVDELRIDGGKLRGEIVLGASKRAKVLAADIAAGIVRNLSIGYTVTDERESTDGKTRTITATRWQPYEASLVAVPADNTVGAFRSKSMTDEAAKPDPLAAERTRVADITEMAKRHGLPEGFALEHITRGTTFEQTREAALGVLADRSPPTMPRMEHIDRNGDGFREATVDALLLRSGIHIEKPHAAARDVTASTIEIARTCLSRAGVRHGNLSGHELLVRAMSTSDFPLILENALHKSVRNGYETEPASHREWVRSASVPDFREQVRPILGSAPGLEEVAELGEYTYGAMDEDSARYSVAKYGRMVGLSWETLVNDNMGAFLRIQPALGQAARRKEADLVYALLTANSGAGQTMQDGVTLFHADHDNLGSSAALNLANLSAARTLLRRQTAVGGGYMNLVPRYVLCCPEYETTIESLIAQTTRHLTTGTDAAAPDFLRNLVIVVEPRLTTGAYYLVAESGQIDTCELGTLDGRGPVIETEQQFANDSRRWKIRHVFGAKFLDWRGIVKALVS